MAASAGTAAQPGMSLSRANHMPTAPSATQPMSRAAWKPPRAWAIGVILTLGVFMARDCAAAPADDPPVNLAKLVAHRATETEPKRDQYTYRWSATTEEPDNRGA